MEKGFILPNGIYVQAVDAEHLTAANYPEGAIEVPLKPGSNYEWSGSKWEEFTVYPTAEEVRSERDMLLLKSDWTQVADAPVDQAAWATYRQQLRDITAQAGFPESVEWPVKPGDLA